MVPCVGIRHWKIYNSGLIYDFDKNNGALCRDQTLEYIQFWVNIWFCQKIVNFVLKNKTKRGVICLIKLYDNAKIWQTLTLKYSKHY